MRTIPHGTGRRGWSSCGKNRPQNRLRTERGTWSFAFSPPAAFTITRLDPQDRPTRRPRHYRCAGSGSRTANYRWTADLDGDGMPAWILNRPKRAPSSPTQGRRQFGMDVHLESTNAKTLPESGVFAQAGPVEGQGRAAIASSSAGKSWKRGRWSTLNGSVITVEQSTPLPPKADQRKSAGQYHAVKVERPRRVARSTA